MSNGEPNESGRVEVEVPLLLSSLADFWSVIEPLLKLAKPKTICEIGLGEGRFTKKLIGYCEHSNAQYCGIDLAADETKLDLPTSNRARFIHQSSLKALEHLPPQDIYFVDGDHNYFTVLNELRLIARAANRPPLIVLHDIAWPWGRRDQYCAPEIIPQEFRHPHSQTLGVRPGKKELGPGGFSGAASAYAYSAAEHEGSARNGVLTAAEDFVRDERNTWELIEVEAIFGLGILFSRNETNASLKAHLELLAQSVKPWKELFARMERNRVDLFLIYLEQVKQLQEIHAAERGLAEYTRGLEARHEALSQKYKELQEAYQTLQAVAMRGSAC